MSLVNFLLWFGSAFLAGAIPFSVLIGRIGLKADIRSFGDGNPGAATVCTHDDPIRSLPG